VSSPRDPKRLRHDLRTPLSQIIGYAELLEEEVVAEAPPTLSSDLGKIKDAARRALVLIDEAFPPGGGTSEPTPSGAAAPAPARAIAPPGPADVPEAASARPARLLVVDDNELNRDMLSRRLRGRGYEVAVVEDGAKALRLLAEAPFDLVLLDVMMPVMSGLDVLRTARATWAASDLPVIMATARGETDDVVAALKLGANDYVTKPFDFAVVLARVEAHLGLKRQREEIRRLLSDLETRNRFIQATFGRYLSDEVVSELLASPGGLALGGEERKVTLLMSDLRGFTATTEALLPEQVVRLLNSYLGAMAEVVLRYQGTIDEFVGDAVLAIFGAPVAREDDARRAVACALAMQLALHDLNEKNAVLDLPRLEMGVAVHTGAVIVGNLGSERRTKYGVVGSPVNHTGRIESFTVGGQVLVSDAALAEAGPDVRVGERIEIEAKGARDPIVVHDLKGIGGEHGLSLPEEADQSVVLAEPVPVRYQFVEGKKVVEDLFDATFVELSARGAVLRSERRSRLLSNLKLEVGPGGGGPPEVAELYAKVVGSRSEGIYVLRFTSLPASVEAWLAERIAAAGP
jgi:adenylate cyclase